MGYSEKARRALAFLFRAYNDIDVYVEDAASRNMYEVLIQRMLGAKAKVSRIFQVGDRSKVIAACAADQADSRARIYLIDGDFDIILGVPEPSLKNLYRLKVYSSENLLVSRQSIEEVAFESLTNTERSRVVEIVGYETWSDSLVECLFLLFVMYGATFYLYSDIKTSGVKVESLCDDLGNELKLSELKIQARIDAIYTELVKQCSEDDIQDQFELMNARCAEGGVNKMACISGKTYLLPLAYHLLRRKAEFSGSVEQLKVRLARYTDLSVDPGLQNALLSASA